MRRSKPASPARPASPAKRENTKDQIEYRLHRFLSDADDELLDQDRFQEECQLIIAKHALGKTLHHSLAQSEAWKDVSWMGRAAAAIGAMFYRRVQTECDLVKKRAGSARAVEFVCDFQVVTEKLHSLEIEVSGLVKEKTQLQETIHNLERELRTSKSELADRIISSRLEHERLVCAAEEAIVKFNAAETERKTAAVTLGQLSFAMEALQARHAETLNKLDELEEKNSALRKQEELLTSQVVEKTEIIRTMQAEQTRLMQAIRYQLEQEREQQLAQLRGIIQNKEEALSTMEDAAARAISEARAFAVELCAAQRDCAALRQEVDVARAHVVSLARGAARIGHFSMRVGGG
jgi:hypothetical protein